MSTLAPALARSAQRLAPTYTVPPAVVERGKALGKIQRARNLKTEIASGAALLTRPSTQGGVKRTNKLTDRGAYGKFRDVLKAATAIGKNVTAKALGDAVETSRAWLTMDNGKLAERGRDEITARKRAAAAWIAEEAELALELDALDRMPVDADSEARVARLDNRATQVEVHKILAHGGKCKPPAGKGESDSFFIHGQDGKLAYIFKPMEGENAPVDEMGNKTGWPEGGGAAREVALSRFNDEMQTALGLDFGVAKTIPVRLDSDAFRAGSKSQAVTRTGALQAAIECDEESPNTYFTSRKGRPDLTPQNIRDYKNSFKVEDIQKIAVLDFLTLNLDRNPGNVLIKKNDDGSRSMRTIDAGNCLPTVEILKKSVGGMTLPLKPAGAPAPEGNFLAQLPKASEPFSPTLLASLQALDPAAIGASMRRSAALEGSMAGKIDESSLGLVEASAKFLKTAALLRLDPALSPYELSVMYANGFVEYQELARAPLASGEDQPRRDAALGLLATRAAEAARREAIAGREAAEFADLGGILKLEELGYDPSIGTMSERMALLRADLPNPVRVRERDELLREVGETVDSIATPDKLTARFKTRSLKDQLEALKAYVAVHRAGGDRGLEALRAELAAAGVTELKAVSAMTLSEKDNFLVSFQMLRSLGGVPQYLAYAEQGLIKKPATMPSLGQIVSMTAAAKRKAASK